MSEPTRGKSPTALVVGASGIGGSAAASLLVEHGWTVHGLARKPLPQPGVTPVAADLLDPAATQAALRALSPDAVFITTWLRQPTEAENIRVNAAMVRNLLAALPKPAAPRHVALVTGSNTTSARSRPTAKAPSPKPPSARNRAASTSRTSTTPRKTRSSPPPHGDGFTWSVHRPHTIIGKAPGNAPSKAMNMGTTLAAYATLCRELGRPFRFPGSPMQWNGLTDMTDARQLAHHLLWATTTPAAHDQAFNIVDGDIFRWSWMWTRLATWFGLDPAPFDGTIQPPRAANGQRRSDLDRDRPHARPRRTRPRPTRLSLAHRRRPRPPHRGRHRYVQEPPPRLHTPTSPPTTPSSTSLPASAPIA